MQVLFANPAGFWALLALPVVLAIHFLQERSRRARVSTLFLLERVKPESKEGVKFERLRNSVPLWLQLLSVLLLAWLLAEPRWIREDSRQTVVVVVDSSVSMSVFKESTRERLASRLRAWAKSASQTEWHLLETDTRRPTLYAGKELAGVLRAFDDWEPALGTHRPDEALAVGRGLVKEHGIVIFVTDRESKVPSDVAVLSAGEPTENVGWAGLEVNTVEPGAASPGMKWKVLVKNYGEQHQTREWWVEQPDGPAQPTRTRLQLAPGQTASLAGELPAAVERATLVLEGDSFSHDDRMPLQRPVERVVRVSVEAGGDAGAVMKRLLGAVAGVSFNLEPGKPADLTVMELGSPVTTDAVQMPADSDEGTSLEGAYTVAEDHELTRDLNWMGLLTPKPVELTLTERDEPLLWKAGRPLAMLRHDQTATGLPVHRLLLAWDVSRSTAARHPAMLVMLHRFVETVRRTKREPWAGNFEAGQVLEVPLRAGQAAPPRQLVQEGRESLPFNGRVPERAGYFTLEEAGVALVRGAVHFADTREADFRKAGPVDTVEERRWEAALRQSEEDPLTPLWVLLVTACLLGAWGWRSGSGSARPAMVGPRTFNAKA